MKSNAKFEPGRVYKTHSLPPDHLPEHVKLVFMFGNPMDIALSTHNMINLWGATHHRNLGSNLFVENDSLFYSDTLQLHKHFDAWFRQHSFRFLSIKYEALYEQGTLDVLNRYLGINLVLPPFRQRASDWRTHPQREQLLQVYGNLHESIENADDVTIWPPRRT